MSMTPFHPLLIRGGPYSSVELAAILQYEGLLGLAPEDLEAAAALEEQGLVEVTWLHDDLVATWIADERSEQEDPYHEPYDDLEDRLDEADAKELV